MCARPWAQSLALKEKKKKIQGNSSIGPGRPAILKFERFIFQTAH
jgi:hypothetical protein